MKTILKYTCPIIIITLLFPFFLSAQNEQPNSIKRDNRRNLVVKEYKTDGKGKERELETEIIYNENGYKIEEIEHATHGVKGRVTYEYNENNRCIREVSYDDRNKVKRIRKIEYNEDGTKKAHYNYLPNGRLYSTKQYEYSRK